MRRILPVIVLVGCYRPPDLPLVDTVPIIPNNACEGDREAQVACVLDGDTFDVGGCGEGSGERIRMLGVDAPEIEHPPEAADCFGDEAHAELASLIEGRTMTLSFDETCVGVFGRTLAYVWAVGAAYDALANEPGVSDYTRTLPGDADVEEALLLNEWLIARGFARVFPEEQFSGDLAFQLDLEIAQTEAEDLRLGLWGACSGT